MGRRARSLPCTAWRRTRCPEVVAFKTRRFRRCLFGVVGSDAPIPRTAFRRESTLSRTRRSMHATPILYRVPCHLWATLLAVARAYSYAVRPWSLLYVLRHADASVTAAASVYVCHLLRQMRAMLRGEHVLRLSMGPMLREIVAAIKPVRVRACVRRGRARAPPRFVRGRAVSMPSASCRALARLAVGPCRQPAAPPRLGKRTRCTYALARQQARSVSGRAAAAAT